jgi:hypothetical protein
MKKSVRLLTLSLLVYCSNSFGADISNHIPLWEQLDLLLCVGKTRMECKETGCEKFDSSAVWNVNFAEMQVSFLTIDFELKLLEKNFKYYSSTNSDHTVFLDDSRSMRFIPDASNSILGQIKAITTSSRLEGDTLQVSATMFDCYPQ